MRVGFIGLGAMGSHMARNLHRAGMLVGVWNRTPEKARALAAELGTAAPGSPAQLAAIADAIVLCVSADQDVLDVVNALAPGIEPGALVMDCSTVSSEAAPKSARRPHARHRGGGVGARV